MHILAALCNLLKVFLQYVRILDEALIDCLQGITRGKVSEY